MITMQEVVEMAATDPKFGRFVDIVVAALKSPDPLASFEWLASVEQDPDLRFGFEKAVELLRDSDGGSRD